MLEKLLFKASKGPGGRPRFDVVKMFKVLVVQRYCNLSDEQTEIQILGRLSFQKFLGMRFSIQVPDQKTVWAFREDLGSNGVKQLFWVLEALLAEEGLVGKEGKIVDAKLIEKYKVTDVSVYDSQAIEELTQEGDGELWADSTYSGEPIEEMLKGKVESGVQLG